MSRVDVTLGVVQEAVDRRLGQWRQAGVAARLWAGDSSLWSDTQQPELSDRLGWLHLPETMVAEVGAIRLFADSVRSSGIEQVVLLGMGGSSLTPELFERTFGSAVGFPGLLVLDTTHPGAVAAAAAALDLGKTLFVVSSKSGGTIETLSLFRYFWRLVADEVPEPGQHFVAITDAGSSLEELAAERHFRALFTAPADVGGRYSALCPFGLVPAALIGADIDGLLASARAVASACRGEDANPGLELGAALGELAVAGRDKLTLVASRTLRAFPDWLEQLIAESTGKDGRGIVPVVGEPLAAPEAYGHDRVFVHLELAAEADPAVGDGMRRLAAAGHPVITVRLARPHDLGGELFRWEVATAAAAMVLGIHPFNQPDVQLAKDLAKRALAGGATGVEATQSRDTGRPLDELLRAWIDRSRPGDYIAIQAFLAPGSDVSKLLARVQALLRDRSRLATTVGFGPRFLHSTGQLHKGGPDTGLFLQVVDAAATDVPVPETDTTFGALVTAQARGDAEALRQRRRRLLEVSAGAEPVAFLKHVVASLD